jgi:hypothetical protein
MKKLWAMLMALIPTMTNEIASSTMVMTKTTVPNCSPSESSSLSLGSSCSHLVNGARRSLSRSVTTIEEKVLAASSLANSRFQRST